jgi:hypothetical protein
LLLVILLTTTGLIARRDIQTKPQNYGAQNNYIHALHFRASSLTGLTVDRDNTLNQTGVSNFTKPVSNLSAVALLNDINKLSLNPETSVVYNCSSDDGVEFSFIFTA